jgi:hypothetical protein
MIFPVAVYSLCLLTSALCAYLLSRSYRATRSRLLFWSALCFTFLALNNFVVVLDMLLLPDIDFRLVRHALALSAIFTLLVGFIWSNEE